MSATTEKRALAEDLREWGLDLSKRVAAVVFGAPVQVPPMIENAAAALELAMALVESVDAYTTRFRVALANEMNEAEQAAVQEKFVAMIHTLNAARAALESL